ncbi:hypothetical protein BJV77DRAFT_1018934 [Russula vinacea]|nr:hypothetical protein BJV77DRAFT_1018934 [Russula vinacea]
MLARVLHVARNGGGNMNFELGQVLASVCACPAEERKPPFVQTLALFGAAWGTPQNEAKASLVVWKRDKFGSRWFRGGSAALGRKRSASVCRRCPIEQRTTNAYCGRAQDGKSGHGACNTHILSENEGSNIDRSHSAKQKVIQGGCLGLKGRQVSNLRMIYSNLNQVWTRLRYSNPSGLYLSAYQ